MHDFIASGDLHLNPISYGIYAFALVFIIIFAILTIMPYTATELRIVGITVIMIIMAVAMTFTMMIRIQNYEGVFKVDNVHYHLSSNHNNDDDGEIENKTPSTITVENEDGIKSSFDYDGHQRIRKGDTIKIVIYGKPNHHPTINKNLDNYKIKSITKTK